MNFKLINPSGEFPMGGYVFTDPKTGMKFDGVGFYRTVEAIIKHRKANPNVYPLSDGKWLDYESVSNELSIYTCHRIGNNSRFCKSTDKVAQYVQAPTNRECPDCHVALNPVYCKVCSGQKLIAFSCPNCGKEYKK